MLWLFNSILKIIEPKDDSVTEKKCFVKEKICKVEDECLLLNISACTSFNYSLLRTFNDLIFNLNYTYSHDPFYKKLVKDICTTTNSSKLEG